MRHPGTFRKRLRVDRKTMVLTSDHDLPGGHILYRMIGTVVAKLHLDRACARGKPKQLMAKADAEQGHFGIEKLADCGYGVSTRFWITRTIG